MALSETPGTKPAAKAAAPRPATSTPSWVFWIYLGGLVLVYVGEHVLSGLEKGPGFVTGLGVIGVLVSTVIRFSPRFRSGGERIAIERLLAVLSATGVLALVLYGLTTDRGMDLTGIARLAEPGRTKTLDLLTVAWIAFITISTLPMIFAETALRPMRSSERPESRRVRAAAEAGFTLGLAAVYLAFFVYAASSVDLDVDFSYFKTSRPSDSTKHLAASVKDPVRVVAFFPQVNEVKNEVERYLNELRPSAPKLRIEILDRLMVPKTARDLKVTQDGVIVLSKGSVNHTLTLGTELESAKAKLKTLDKDFQEQLQKIARDRRTVYVTVGHGELNETPRGPTGINARSGSIAKQLLQRQNLVVKDLGLAQGLANEVPTDADLVLVLGPTEPFSKEELATLRRYADGGGKLFFALDADAFSARDVVPRDPGSENSEEPKEPAPAASASAQPASSAKPKASAAPASSAKPPVAPVPAVPTSALDELARVVGVAFSSDILANERAHVRLRSDDSDRTRLVVQSFSSHAAVSTLSRNAPRAAVIVFGSGSLDRAPGATERTDFAIRSPSGTFADVNKNFRFDKDTEKQAVFNIGAAVTKQLDDGAAKDEKKDAKGAKDAKKKDTKELRAFVLADGDALSDFVMAEVLANQVLFVDAVRWLIGEEALAGIPNTEEDQKIQHTKQEDLAWFYSSIFGAPALILGLGVWLSRRSHAKGGRR